MSFVQAVVIIMSMYSRPYNHPVYGAEAFSEAVLEASLATGVPAEILVGLAIVESSMKHDAIGKYGSYGFFQLNPKFSWGKKAIALCSIGAESCVKEQAMQSARLIRRLQRKCGTGYKALAAYHGEGCRKKSKYSEKVIEKSMVFAKLVHEKTYL